MRKKTEREREGGQTERVFFRSARDRINEKPWEMEKIQTLLRKQRKKEQVTTSPPFLGTRVDKRVSGLTSKSGMRTTWHIFAFSLEVVAFFKIFPYI